MQRQDLTRSDRHERLTNTHPQEPIIHKHTIPMKTFITRTISLMITAIAFLQLEAQTTIDVVELKNGSVLRGTILEQVPNESLKLKTADGSLFVYRMDEVVKITRETAQNPLDEKPDMSKYGGTFGLGVAIGGGGLVGFPIRSYVTKNVVLEAGVFLRPAMVNERVVDHHGWEYYQRDEKHLAITGFFAGGMDVMLGERYDTYDRRIIRNGIMFRSGTNLSSRLDESMVALGWVRERFNRESTSGSYNFCLGLGALMYGNENDNPLTELDIDLPFMPMIYWKLNWNWYVAKRTRPAEAGRK